MTSRICSKTKFFAFSLRQQTGISLLGAAFSFLICPGTVLREAVGVRQFGYYYDLSLQIDILSIFVFLIALALGAVLQCYQHGYLFSKKSADLYCTLPLRRDSLLIIRFGASFVGAVFSMTVSFVGLAFANSLSGVHGIAFAELAKLYGLSLLLLLLCMSAVQIFVVNAGTVFNVVFSAAVVCVGLPLLCLIGYSWKASAAFGVIESYDWTQYISPSFSPSTDLACRSRRAEWSWSFPRCSSHSAAARYSSPSPSSCTTTAGPSVPAAALPISPCRSSSWCWPPPWAVTLWA